MLPVKIFLICADDSLLNSLTSCLSQAGYKLLVSQLGAGALEMIQAEKPDLVILEYELPDYNSLAIIRAIRKDELYDQMPVVLVGANIRENDILIGLEVGADLCLFETFHPQVFVARIRSLLRRNEIIKIR